MTTFHRARAAGARALLPLLLLAVAPLAHAGHTFIDFNLDNNPPSNNTQGEAWEFSNAQCSSATAPATCMIDFNAVTNSGAVDIGFNVNINGTKFSKVFVNKNAILTFATGLGAFAPADHVQRSHDQRGRSGQSVHRGLLSEQRAEYSELHQPRAARLPGRRGVRTRHRQSGRHRWRHAHGPVQERGGVQSHLGRG